MYSSIKTTRADKRQNINNYQSWVYGLYLDGRLVYVGVTGDPDNRLLGHIGRKKFDEFRLIKGFSSRTRAEEYENTAILLFEDEFGLLNIIKEEPRRVGFHNRLPTVTNDDLKGWHGNRVNEFDFSLLNNDMIQRRMRRK